MRLEEGQVVGGRYRLIGRLGSGGMADVWCADDQMLDRRVALKFLHERFAQDHQFVERFRREAQAAAGLQHPNVVGVYDRGESEGRHWIAMEYVEGAALKDLISRGLSVGEAVEIVRQVLAAARFAHEHGIVHRDLKPQNVLVDAEGRARVTDFGIARVGVSEITQTGSVLGTAQYLSPEQAQGLEITAASDLYSVGVLLYEALTGSVPFEADSPVAVALKQVSEQPRPPSELNPQVSRALDAVVLRALAKDPENRFASAQEFIRALDAAEADPSGGTLGDTAAYAPVAAGALGGAAGAAAAGAGEAAAEPTAGPGWLTRRRAIALGLIALLGVAAAIFALTRTDEVTVPGVIEEPVAEARSLLERRGFEVVETPVATCAPSGTVTEQDPPAGSDADEGSRVALTVSLGLAVTVPPTRGQPLDRASRLLQAEQLLVDTRELASRDVAPGRVIRSDPAAGEEAECQSTVTLFASRGPNLVTLPDVIGLQQASAVAQLERLGFIVDVDTQDADEPAGQVIDESPSPGSELLRGRTVTITVSTGAGSVIVPNVIGQSEDGAIDTLQARGLSVDVIEQETEDPGDDGRVLEQAPTAGERLRSGDVVTIVVGEFVEPEPPPDETGPATPPEFESP
ncbi:MAG: Stk1 family PASTA domain-containing Ser/Thr kinase [Solirubrobacterales bacterium]